MQARVRLAEDRRVTADDEASAGRALIESGRPVAGSMCQGAASVLFSPETAAVQLDASLVACLRAAAVEASAVQMPRERVRAGAVLAFAVEHAATLERAGRVVRADGFFTDRTAGRPAAASLAEAVTAAARRSTDERRVRHLGYLVAEAAVSPDIDLDLALRALRYGEALGWRQLALLAGVGRRTRVPLPLAPLAEDPRAWPEWGAREDLTGLQDAGLVEPPPAVARPGGAPLPRLRAADLRLTRRGVLVHRLLALDFVREEAVAGALADLGLPRS
jgi:hypothetical protein